MSATTIQDVSSDVKCLVAAGSFGASFRKATPGRASDQVPPLSPVATTAGAGNVRQKHTSNQLCLWGSPHGFSAQRAGSRSCTRADVAVHPSLSLQSWVSKGMCGVCTGTKQDMSHVYDSLKRLFFGKQPFVKNGGLGTEP